MSAATTDALALVGLLAITGAVAIVLRERFGDRGGPILPSDLEARGRFLVTTESLTKSQRAAIEQAVEAAWAVRCGDQFPVCHNGTDNR